MSLMAAITLTPRDGEHLLVDLAATVNPAAAQHRREMERLSSVQNPAKNLVKQSRKSSRISVMASNILSLF